MAAKRVGVLALQGDFEAHRKALERAGAEAVPVRTEADLGAIDGLVIPGGESSTMLRILQDEGLFEPLRRFGERRPIFGTCAGAILMAREVSHPVQASLGLVSLAVERNAYGRQLDSRIVTIEPEEVFAREAGPGEL
ncbi:MAG TPA: pyridoxal 5'-phosphate synthase glutaminase subunit PdxT, partial [Bryobacteraceae bacterium]|nr:pyridoxal 5'-phosphate synthase glutaminase subunit PdxT [Bryobacteraceae bacterium]